MLPQGRRDTVLSHSQFVQISDACCVLVLLQFFAHAVCNHLYSNLANLEATVKVRYILEFFSLTTQWWNLHDEQ